MALDGLVEEERPHVAARRRHLGLDHARAEPLEIRHPGVGRVARLGLAPVADLGRAPQEPDRQPLEPRLRHGEARQHRPEQRDVLDAPPHRPDRVERRDEREDAVERQVAPARLQAHRPARGRRQPDRAAGVRSEPEVDEPGGERRRVPGRRAAGGLPGMERVVDGAVPRVDAEHAPRELGQVGLADDDRAGVERSLDDGRVGGRDVVAVDARAVGRPDPGGVDQVLDEQRAPGERPVGGAEQRLVEPGDRGVVRVGDRLRLSFGLPLTRTAPRTRPRSSRRGSRGRRSRRASRPAASRRTPPGAPG